MNRLYGAWAGKNDTIPVYEFCGHEEAALVYLQNKFTRISKRRHGINHLMFRLGFIRVIYWRYGVEDAEYYYKTKLTKLQKDLVKEAKFPDIMMLYRWQDNEYNSIRKSIQLGNNNGYN